MRVTALRGSSLVARFKVSPYDDEITKALTRPRKPAPGQPETPDRHKHQRLPYPHPHPQHPSTPSPAPEPTAGGALTHSPPSPPSWSASPGGRSLLQKLWWAVMGWMCTQWLHLSVYGVDLRAAATKGPLLVVVNHISQLDYPVVTMALRSLGVDEVVCVGERDFPTTMESALLGNVLPVLRAVGPPEAAAAAAAGGAGTGLQQQQLQGRGQGQGQAAPRVVRGEGLTAAVVDEVRAAVEQQQQQQQTASGAGGAPSRPRTRAVVLFPERGVGGREGGLRPWRLSPAYLAARAGWHVVPGYVLGTQRCLPRHFSIPSRGRVAVEFGLPLPPPPKEAGASDSESHLPLSSRSALSWHDRCVREAMALLRASLRARRNSNWRAPRPRNRRPTPGSGLAGHVSYTAWRAYGLLSVMLWGLFMVPLRLVDTVRVAGVWLVHLARGAAGM